jgi:hypothetical protein
LEGERAKALIVGEGRQQPVGPFDDFVDCALVAVSPRPLADLDE